MIKAGDRIKCITDEREATVIEVRDDNWIKVVYDDGVVAFIDLSFSPVFYKSC